MKQAGKRVDFAEPHRKKKQEATPLPQFHNIIGSETGKAATKGSASKSTRVPRESNVHASVAPDAMTWANTWQTMNRTVEAFVTRNTKAKEEVASRR